MEFKTTNHFFDKLRNNGITKIDIENYIFEISKKHNIEKLKTILEDIDFYLFEQKEILENNINTEDWSTTIEYYLSIGQKMPTKKIDNLLKKLEVKKGLEVSISSDFIEYVDVEKIFYPYEFFSFYQLKKYIIGLIQKNETPKNPNQPELTRTKIFTFKNNFDSVNTEIVHKHFKENLVDKNYLSIEVLEQFLIMAFQEQRQLENKFTFDKHTTNDTIIKIFYDYYSKIARSPYGKQIKYIELLCNYFVGYNAQKIHSNFSR
jgi:hypothetical protein